MCKAVSVLQDLKLPSKATENPWQRVTIKSEQGQKKNEDDLSDQGFLTWQPRAVPLPSEIAVLLEKGSMVTFGFSKGGWKVPKYKEPFIVLGSPSLWVPTYLLYPNLWRSVFLPGVNGVRFLNFHSDVPVYGARWPKKVHIFPLKFCYSTTKDNIKCKVLLRSF